MLVLGLESTCDETGCSIVRDGKDILSNVVTSQIDLHNAFGGVVPELACRRHVEVVIPVIEKAISDANIKLSDVDVIAVANAPGLVGALMIGLVAAKTLAKALNIPFVGVNHTQAHLYAALMNATVTPTFPCLGVVLSGGHTALVEMSDVGTCRLLGQTCDDAIGEAYDKVAKLMGLPYPGGPEIEALAKQGNSKRFPFKAGRVKRSQLDFSFSGLKTAVLYAIDGRTLTQEEKCDISASFQEAALNSIMEKISHVSHQYQTIVFGGGVTNNKRLRELCSATFPNHTLVWPQGALTLDNAAMIAGLGYHVYRLKGEGDPFDLEAIPTMTW